MQRFCAASVEVGTQRIWTVGQCLGERGSGCEIPADDMDTCAGSSIGDSCRRLSAGTTEIGVCRRDSLGKVECVPTLDCQKAGETCTVVAGGDGICKPMGMTIKCLPSGDVCLEQDSACVVDAATGQRGLCKPNGARLACKPSKLCSRERDVCLYATRTGVVHVFEDGRCVRLDSGLLTCEPAWFASSACITGRACVTKFERDGVCLGVPFPCRSSGVITCPHITRNICLAKNCFEQGDRCVRENGAAGICNGELVCDEESAAQDDDATASASGLEQQGLTMVASLLVALVHQHP
jgi:hypothetical protein